MLLLAGKAPYRRRPVNSALGSTVTPTELKAPLLASLHALLKPLGFRKLGSTFQRECGDVVHLIELQGSRANVSDDARFTVNVGVFAPAAIYEDIRHETKPSIAAAHWRERIGFLGAEAVDLWWKVNSPASAEAAAEELSIRVARDALPRLDTISSLYSLVQLWLSGKSPGVPPKQRDDFLQRLGHGKASSAA